MSAGDQPEIVAEVRNHVGHLTLNRPAALNALSMGMVRDLHAHLDRWARDPDVRAVTIRGAGEKAFCAGGDIRALYDSRRANDDLHMMFFREEYALDIAIHRYPKPILACMDGYVMGGGMGLAQGSSLRIATDRTRMAMPEVGIGYFPDVGGSYFLSRLPGALGLYLGLTGRQIRAADALYCGLADAFLPSGTLAELDARLDALDWQGKPADGGDKIGALLDALGAQPALPDAPLAAVRDAIDRHFSLPSVPAVVASLRAESDPACKAWAEETLQTMAKRSPLAMCVTHELLRRGRDLPLERCFDMEFALDRAWLQDGDFVEGVRALIVDKDNAPRWRPASLDEVAPQQVQAFFARADEKVFS
ncbi:MAG: enoyl-CoA hydratase/isomerase family protein [Burkholderiaceae bacterium]